MYNIISPTGFIIPDVDHLQADDLKALTLSLKKDKYLWFGFLSPSGDGLKVGIRAEGIETDADHKIFYAAVERYFKESYAITIDPACKDIGRLTYLSWDPDLFINDSPQYFPVEKWKPVQKTAPENFSRPIENSEGDWKSKYGRKVLDSCCQKIRQAVPGGKHDTNLKMALLVGGYIASGFIDETVALSALKQAMLDSGTKLIDEAMKTIRDGIAKGRLSPINVESKHSEKSDIKYNFDDIDDIDDQGDKRRHLTTLDDTLTTDDDTCSGKNDPNKVDKSSLNLHTVIREWIKNSSGSFTTEQLDRDLVLTTREEKKQRSKILSRCIDKKLVKKDKRGAGKFHIINSTLDEINLDDIDETPFDLFLPLSLHRYSSIPKKSIIVIAGSSDAGKTALILNTLKLNLNRNYKKMYLMSEMGKGEYADRLRQFKDVDFSEWKKVTAAERNCDFDGAIENHNPNGLTCIDFLEEVEGDFFKIPTDIRHIYDALGLGVAIIAIQKKTDSDYARGGQGTAEKARLYLSVDKITTLAHSVICAVKVIKNKRYLTRNLTGHELHFRIHHGSLIEPVSEWMRSSDTDRNKFKAKYEQQEKPQKKGFSI